MEEYKNHENIKNKTSFSTIFKLDIVENSHYEFESYNDLLRKMQEYIADNYQKLIHRNFA